ncbi:MAG: peroxiredoxin [Pseudomonadota bacterium]
MSELTEGNPAPDFSLPGDGESEITLSAHRGKTVVVYFYPKDNTSGCTKEAVAFNELAGDFEKAGAVIIGVSPDPVKSHDKFKEKYDLSFALAADEEKAAAQAYDVWKEKSMYGKKYMGVERSTFLVAPDGTLAKIWRKVKVPGHAEAVLAAARALKG